MKGRVDSYGRALVAIALRGSEQESPTDIDAWIDTGFNGELVLPQETIDKIGLQASGTLKATLADGSEVYLMRYTCLIDWFDESRELEVIANLGEYPLLGVGLLVGLDLSISYRSGEIVIA